MIQSNSYKKVKQYFKNLQEQSNFLNDFVGFSEREWNSRKASRMGIASPVLALFRYELGLDAPEKNAMAVRKVAFAVMLKVQKPDDFEGQTNAVDEAEALALKILARINYDSNDTTHFLYNSFIKESVQINPVELSANDFGVEVFFHFRNFQPMKVDLADWKDITKIC